MKLSQLYESVKTDFSGNILQLFKENSIDINKFVYLDLDKIKKPEHYNILNNIIDLFFEYEEFNFNEYYIDWTYNEILQKRIRSAEDVVDVLIEYDKNYNIYNGDIFDLLMDLNPEAMKQRLKRLRIVDAESFNMAKDTKSFIYLINSEELINIYLEKTNQHVYGISISLYDKNINIIYEDNKYYVYKINDISTLKELSKRTRWCTKTDKYSNIYFNENVIYHIYDKNLQLPIIQFTGNKSEIKNRNNVNDHHWDEFIDIILSNHEKPKAEKPKADYILMNFMDMINEVIDMTNTIDNNDEYYDDDDDITRSKKNLELLDDTIEDYFADKNEDRLLKFTKYSNYTKSFLKYYNIVIPSIKYKLKYKLEYFSSLKEKLMEVIDFS